VIRTVPAVVVRNHPASSAGSRSLKMADVFKSKKDWPLLIESNGRGAYRLAGI
jgi:hypothetical protein